jgi:KDO2-lipid IV(A) lauroyltransferase
MNKPAHVIEYGAIRLLEALVSAPRLPVAIRWGERLGMFVGKVMRGRDRLIIANLKAAFPTKPDAEIRAIADGVWRNIGRVAVEFIRAREIVTEPLEPKQIVENIDVVESAFAEGRGVIFVAGHYCNWEINGIILNHLVINHSHRFTAIARPMRNPLAERWVQSRRADGGIPIILHREAVRASLRVLRKGDAIGILVDQNLYTGGVFVNFFGRPAATTPLPALLASRTGSPVLLTHLARVKGQFRIRFERVDLKQVVEETNLTVATQAINDRLEAAIGVKPEWWFWIHNRWKRSAEALAAQAASS